MQPLNYCRQLAKALTEMLAIPNLARQKGDMLMHVLALCKASQKFIMPPNGRLMDDRQLRGLDDEIELRLPHPFIALEYEITAEKVCFDPDVVTRDIVFAWEAEEGIVIQRVGWAKKNGSWGIGCAYVVPRSGYLQHVDKTGHRRFRFARFYAASVPGDDEDADALGPSQILCFLNALACSNVRIEKSEAGKVRKAMRKKDALPFDDYHVLTIDSPVGKTGDGIGNNGSHRSPREHLRRGHIRRYESGAKIWVNATVVNAGIGGRVTKDYKMVAAHALH